jgi:hypothetical protein
MTLRGRIMRLESRSPAQTVTGARERLVAYLDAIAARLPIGGATPRATVADLKADLAAILQRPRP